jgi:hypothetical protein
MLLVAATVGASLQDADLVIETSDKPRLTLLPGFQQEAKSPQSRSIVGANLR